MEEAGSGEGGGLGKLAVSMNVAKAIMGAGGFAIPWAFAKGGLALTPAIMASAMAVSLFTLQAMLQAKNEAVTRGWGVANSYADIARATMGPLGGRVVDVMTVFTCFGICASYMVFMAATLADVVSMSQIRLVAYLTPVMMSLSWLRDLSYVSVTSALGNVSVYSGMAFVAFVALQRMGAAATSPLAAFPAGIAWAHPAAAFSIFGSVAYLFFIHFTLPEIESSMREKLRGSFVGSVATAFLGTFTISSIFGIIGALGFGAGVSSVVVTELAASPAATTVKVLLVLNLLFTFPVVGRAAFTTLEREMCKTSGAAQSDDLNGPAVLAMRSAFVALAAFCAVSIPSFGRLLGLVGGVCCSALTIFFPPLMLLRVDSRLRSEGAGGIVGAPYKAALYLTVMFGLGVMGLSVLES